MTPAPSHLLYLHGFRSSPRSFKALQLHAWMSRHRPEVHWDCPQLPPAPDAAMRLVAKRIEGWPRETTALVGSSLGGFYATVWAERLGCSAVLLNPAVAPARDLAAYIGVQTAYHDPAESFVFRPEDVDALRALRPPILTGHERYFVVIAKGDEVLDWREMNARYTGCRIKLLEGSDHALSDFGAHLPDVLDFLHLCSKSRAQ